VDALALLELRNVDKLFGKLAALKGINLEIEEGQLTGIAGPNGSGKTTLFNVVSGFYGPTKGDVIFDGKRLNRLRPDQRASRGVIRTFQSNVLYKEATVLENMLRAQSLQFNTNSWQAFFATPAYRKEERILLERAWASLDSWGFTDTADVVASELAHGDQRRLGVALAAAMNPKLLLIDEPIGGMSGEERTATVRHIKQLNEQGISIMLVEHHVETLLAVCDRLVVLDFGSVIADGRPDEVVTQPRVVEAYLGTEEVTE